MRELLSDVLRQVLRADQPREVPLAEELRFLERYLEITVHCETKLNLRYSGT